MAEETIPIEVVVHQFQMAVDYNLPIHEGHRDYGNLNIKTETKEAISDGNVAFQRRQDLLVKAVESLQALEADGYPNVPEYEVEDAVYDDLEVNAKTILAALSRYHRKAASVSEGEFVLEDPK